MGNTYSGFPIDSEAIYLVNYAIKLNTVNIAVISSIGYDIIYCFFDEVKYIWCGMNWSIPKVLYVIARYNYFVTFSISVFLPPLFDAFGIVSSKFCHAAIWYDFIVPVILGTAVDLIFAFRVSACYGNNKKIVWFLGICLFVSIAYANNFVDIPGLVCIVNTPENANFLNLLQTVYFGLNLAIHSAMFLLTIFRFWKDISIAQGGVRNLLQGRRSNFPILASFMRDGIFYFFVVFVINVLQTWSSIDPNGIAFDVYFTPWYYAMQSVMGSRLILNLRQISDANGNTSTSSMSRSIFFAHPALGTTNTSVEEHEMDQV